MALRGACIWMVCLLCAANAAASILQYNFEGNVQDSSGNGRDGTVQGTVSYAAGYTGQALSLDGSGWVDMPNNVIRGNPTLTISLRFKTTSYGAILGYQQYAAESPSAWNYVPILTIVPADGSPTGATGKLRAEYWTTAGGLVVLSNSAVNDGNWHQVVLSATPTTIVVYLDGTLLGTQTGNIDHLDMQFNQIGTARIRKSDSTDPWRRFTGLIDDLLITADYVPVVTTGAVTAIGTTTATGNGTITDLGDPTATQHGVCWSTSANPTTADNKTQEGVPSATGSFTSSITGLTSGVTYHVRAYATNSVDTAYGSDQTFTTDTAPTVTTAAVSDVTESAATSGGNVTADGGDTVTARGVCWSTSSNPTIADSLTTDGSGTGSFTSSLGGLAADTTYHVRAYATNSIGTSYGSDVSFKTGIAVTTSGGSAVYPLGGTAVVVDPNVTVAAQSITGFKVSITGNLTSGDVLGYTGTPPSGVSGSYNGTTGVLTFTGTASAANWQALLRTVTFRSTAGSTATRTVAFTAGGAIPSPDTSHYYEYVASANITWGSSQTAAGNATLFGLQGYLATITSQAENDFISQKLGADAWIGGSDAAVEGTWRWVTGPEAGTQFSSGSTPVNGQYANWNTGEPNNSGGNEDCLEIYSSGGGKWNDLSNTATLSGYVVEYGGMAGDPSIRLSDSRDVHIASAPTVTTATVTSITTTTAACGGNVTADGGDTVTACGVCWSTSANPTIAGSHTTDGSGTGSFTSSISGLDPGVTYHVRAYATNGVGTSYGSDVSFTTGIAVTTSDGTAAYIVGRDAAVVDPDLEIAAASITNFVASVTGNFASGDVLAFTGSLPGGVSAAYNSSTGILTFTGTASGAAWQTLLRTLTFSSTSTSVAQRTVAFTAGGAIPFSGNGHYYEFVADDGITFHDAITAAQGRSLFGLQGYLVTVTSAQENAFVSGKLAGEGWMGASDEAAESVWRWVTGPEGLEDSGNGRHFFTETSAAASSGDLYTVYDGATPGGGVAENGAYNNWANGEPNDWGAEGENCAHFRAAGNWNDYAFDNGAIAGYVVEYGGMPDDPTVQITDTRAVAVTATPTVTTATVANVTPTSASCGGNVTADGGVTVTARGVCWSTSANPTIADSKTSDGTGTGVFTSSLTGLSPGVTYHVRAYATNSIDTSYGTDVPFTTETTTPTVSTTTVSDITPTAATTGGNVTADGGTAVTARGVCWNTTGTPTIADSKSTDGTGTGEFTSSLTGLIRHTVYYVRAYATNGVGTAYGSEESFTTGAIPPTVTTTAASNVTATAATAGGNISDDNGATVTARGVCWSTGSTPTIADRKTTNGTGTGTFTSSLSGLSPNTVYYVRAYATNGAGTDYGDQVTLTTAAAPDNSNEPPPAPDLRVSVLASGRSAIVGDELSFQVNVENLGTADATDVVLRFPLPANAEFVGAWLVADAAAQSAPLNAYVAGDEILIALGNVAITQSMKLDVVLKATASGAVSLDASATCAEQSTPATARANSSVNDVYYEILDPVLPIHTCGALGFVLPLLLSLGLLTMKRRGRVSGGRS